MKLFDLHFNRCFDFAVVTCDPPAGIPNGLFNPDKDIYNYRDVVQYSCTGDLILNGSKSVTCSEDGTFTPGPPQCTRECLSSSTLSHHLSCSDVQQTSLFFTGIWKFSTTVVLSCFNVFMQRLSVQTQKLPTVSGSLVLALPINTWLQWHIAAMMVIKWKGTPPWYVAWIASGRQKFLNVQVSECKH